MTTTPTPTTTPATKPHKQASIEATIAALASGGSAIAFIAFAHAHLPVQYAAVTAVIATVLAFARKEAPYVAKIVKGAVSVWRVARKNKKVAAVAAKVQADALAWSTSDAGKAVIAAAVAAAKIPAVAADIKSVEVAAVSAPVAPVATPAPGSLAADGL